MECGLQGGEIIDVLHHDSTATVAQRARHDSTAEPSEVDMGVSLRLLVYQHNPVCRRKNAGMVINSNTLRGAWGRTSTSKHPGLASRSIW